MPRATLSIEPQHEDLKTCPGGFVSLRRMSYGELMTSQDMAYQVSMKANQENADDPEMGLNISRAAVQEYQFRTCILDHNLENEAGQKLDFTRKETVHLLDSIIGLEISSKIDDMHNWTKLLPNSSESSASASSTASETTESGSSSTPSPSESAS